MQDMTAAIENAIVSAIEQSPFTWRPRFVGSYGGEFDGDWEQVVRSLPGIWIACGGGPIKPANAAKTKWHHSATFGIMVAQRNVRGEAATRHGTQASNGKLLEVGTYQMKNDVARAITGQQFGLDITPMEPTGWRTLYNTKLQSDAISVLALEYKTTWVETSPAPGEQDDAECTAIHVAYHTPGQEQDAPLATDLIRRP